MNKFFEIFARDPFFKIMLSNFKRMNDSLFFEPIVPFSSVFNEPKSSE